MRLNPSDDAPLVGFTVAMNKWISNATLKVIATKFILLETHYKYDKLNNMAKLLDMIDKSWITSYL